MVCKRHRIVTWGSYDCHKAGGCCGRIAAGKPVPETHDDHSIPHGRGRPLAGAVRSGGLAGGIRTLAIGVGGECGDGGFARYRPGPRTGWGGLFRSHAAVTSALRLCSGGVIGGGYYRMGAGRSVVALSLWGAGAWGWGPPLVSPAASGRDRPRVGPAVARGWKPSAGRGWGCGLGSGVGQEGGTGGADRLDGLGRLARRDLRPAPAPIFVQRAFAVWTPISTPRARARGCEGI